jgi:hypothetical protein
MNCMLCWIFALSDNGREVVLRRTIQPSDER